MSEFRRFDPSLCHFPRPGAPLLPVPRWSELASGADTSGRSALDEPAGAHFFSRGRYALHAAYGAAGVGPGGALMAPAYHCRTMLDPALALGGPLALYRVHADLTPDLADIAALADASRIAVRALVLPHYFGFEQPAELTRELTAFCRSRGIMLIEDCSHAWKLALARAELCRDAPDHAVVASPYKYFACADGGVLWGAARPGGDRALVPAGWLRELAAARSMLSQLRGPQPPNQDGSPDSATACGAEITESSDQPSGLYDRAAEGKRGLALSRWVIGRSRPAAIAEKRRANYARWLDAVAPLTGGRALFATMPPDCAPYMFPLVMNAPEPYFCMLKQRAMPIYRWDDMAVSDCEVASRYRLRLLHLPCHQSLSERQMQWMISVVTEVLQ